MATNVPNPGNYLAALGQKFTTARDLMRDFKDQSNYIASMGGTTFLTTAFPNGLGMTATDAAALVAALGNMAALATHYQGGAQAPALNYEANSEPFWGGS